MRHPRRLVTVLAVVGATAAALVTPVVPAAATSSRTPDPGSSPGAVDDASPAGAASATGSTGATDDASAARAASPAGAATSYGPVGGPAPVPDGFRAQSASWTSPTRGWVLGTASVDGSGPSPVIRTVDGGRRWATVGTVPDRLAPPGEPGVTELRFADAHHGWAFGPSLHATHDGGRTWRPAALPGGGQQVIALEANAQVVYAVVSPCAIGTPPYECTQPSTVWRAPAGPRPAWEQVPVELPVVFQASIALHRRVAYVTATQGPPAPDLFYATTDGRHWSARPTPCRNDEGEGLVDVAAISAREVALLCIGDPGWSQSVKRVLRSADTGLTVTPAGTAPLEGIHAQLAAGPDGRLLLASASSGSWLYLNAAGEQWTTVLALGDHGADWNSPTFTTATTGFVIHAPAAWANGAGTLLTTDDGGQTWVPVPFRSGTPPT